MTVNPDFPLTVFYDGSCAVCAGEIEHYLRSDHGRRLVAVDISAADFNPAQYRINREAFMYELHTIDSRGTIYRGVDSFLAIWRAFPDSALLRFMAAVIAMPFILPFARIAYKCFARIRPYLPRKHGCRSGTCRIPRRD